MLFCTSYMKLDGRYAGKNIEAQSWEAAQRKADAILPGLRVDGVFCCEVMVAEWPQVEIGEA